MRKRASGRWQVAYVGPDARLHRAPVTFDDEDAAIGWLNNERKLIQLDAWTPPEERVKVKAARGQTFAQYTESWIEARRTRRGPIKPTTKSEYQRYLNSHILPTFGNRQLRTITQDDVNAWYLAMNHRTPTERAHAYQLLRAIFNSALKDKLIGSNPAQIDGAGRVERAHEIKVATLEELAVIVEHMPDRLKLAVLLAAWCALRYGEVAELRRKDVDLRNGRIKVQRGVTWAGGQVVVGTPKSEAGRRVVHMPPHLMPLVKAHLANHTEPGAESLLFPAASGGHMHPRTFGKRFNQARVAAGRPDLHYHDLRHSGAVLAAQAGATLAELMARLGHSTAGAAMRYQHAAAGRDKAIAEALSRMAEG